MLAAAGVGTRRPVTYLHHPLIMGDDGRKLSKSTGAAGVRSMRHRGLSPEVVIGLAASTVGLWPVGQPLSARQAPLLFDAALQPIYRSNPR